MVMWDDGTPAPPDANIAPSEGSDPHGTPRSQPEQSTSALVVSRFW